MRRKGYRPVHLLAKYAIGIVNYVIWMEENPCFLKQLFIVMYYLLLLNKVLVFLSKKNK